MYKTFVISFCFLVIQGFAQVTTKIPDSLLTKSYSALAEGYDTNSKDKSIAKLYAQAFLNKAKSEKDIIKQADGYYKLAKIVEQPIAILYADSIITLTKDQSDFTYPAEAHLFKARYFGANGQYQSAMEELAEANNYANANNNLDQQHNTKYFIALLKNNLGEYDKALKLFTTVNKYYQVKFEKEPKTYQALYLKSIYALGDSYVRNQQYANAEKQNEKGIALSLQSKDSLFYGSLLLLSGNINYHTKEYSRGLDSLYKLENIYANRLNKIKEIDLIEGDFYKGQIYYRKKEVDSAINILKKVDSLTFKRAHFFPDLRPTYETLIKSYKQKENTEKQLYYINRLLKFDSIVDQDVKYLYRKINDEYSTPNLLSEKEKIINSLQKKSKNGTTIIVVLAILSIALVLFLYLNIQKRKIYQQRFQELFAKKEEFVKDDTIQEIKKDDQSTNDIGISQDIIDDILAKLTRFEEKQGYLKPNITVSSLSKDLKTNSKYLSKTINAFKQKSFSNYINDLRIHFIVEKLKAEPKFRRYTIKAISSECGFNTTEAFSKSFYKTTGIYPSFFLKQLEKQEENT